MANMFDLGQIGEFATWAFGGLRFVRICGSSV